MKARRFVNAVTGYSVSRIKLMDNLFYPSTAEAQKQAAAMAAAKEKNMKEDKQATAAPLQKEDYDELPLPTPRWIGLRPSSRQSCAHMDLNFLPFYSARAGGEGNFLCLDGSGHAALYDADACTVELMPSLGTPQNYHPVSCSVTHADAAADPARPDALYVMDSEGGSSFQALVYGDPSEPWDRRPSSPSDYRSMYDDRYAWHWRTLPTPPILDAEDYDSFFLAQCYALLHGQEDAGSTICVSFYLRDRRGPGGTYCFDTASHEWTKAGGWTLPFCSRAHHVPELGDGLLFGLEHRYPFRFCAMDVSGAIIKKMASTAPVLRHAWLDVDPPDEWNRSDSSVAYLGDGKFCIHRSFDILAEGAYGDWDKVDSVTLLTGVEVVRAPGSSRLRMVKHKSKCLDFDIEYVL